MKRAANQADPMVTELVAIKKLLVFQLLEAGATQKQIGAVLGIDQAQVSRMFPQVPKRPKTKG